MEKNRLNYEDLKKKMIDCALDVGFAVRQRVNEIPRTKRAEPCTSVLKPEEKDKAKYADAEGERVGFELLQKLSQETSVPIGVVVNPQKGDVYEIGDFSRGEVMYCYFDAVDGTIKVAGLGSEHNIHRVGNNGCWATGIAFTDPTKKDLSDLVVGDFKTSALVDGNPTQYRAYPTNAVFQKRETSERDETTGEFYALATSSQTNIGQATVLFDAFQAFDRNSAPEGAEDLATGIYRALINRNEGGAFDIVRMYANMGETLRQLLERREPRGGPRIEPQSAGAITINENLPNLVPITPVIEGAGGVVETGGIVTDFSGRPIRNMPLTADRPNVIIAANRNMFWYLKNLIYFAGGGEERRVKPDLDIQRDGRYHGMATEVGSSPYEGLPDEVRDAVKNSGGRLFHHSSNSHDGWAFVHYNHVSVVERRKPGPKLDYMWKS